MSTIAEVARAAGVSVSTVSYVLSGRRPISGPTRERVLLAVRELGYRPHAGASSLAEGRTHTIGLIAPHAPDLTGAIIHRFVTTIRDAARARDHDLLLLDPREGTGGIRRAAESRLVDGLILMDTDDVDERATALEAYGFPAVALGSPGGTGLTCVDLDFAEAARLAVGHLTARGRTELALMSPAETSKGYATHTRQGFTEAVRTNPHAVRACAPSRAGVHDWVDAVWRELGRVTGIVVQHEAALPYLLPELRRTGKEDVTVVPICPAEFAAQLEPPAAHVDVPIEALARAATDALFDQLDGRAATSYLIEPRLAVS